MVISATVDTGDLLTEERVGKIHREKTTRSQLLNLLGPPDAVLREGTKATISAETGSEELSYELAFLPFAEKYQPSPNYAVFYYQNISASSFGMIVVAAGTNKTDIERKRLWVLVEEQQGIVADYVFRSD